VPDLIIHLRPTTPLRDPDLIDRAIDTVIANKACSSLRSVHELAEPPQKEFQIDEKGFLKGFFPEDKRAEYYNLPRQSFPKAYHPNGYVDVIRGNYLKKSGLLYGPDMLGYVTPLSFEVDHPEDFEIIEYMLEKRGSLLYRHLKDKYGERVTL
jgi:CMP-N-acetylneuraminic acid synthetase